MNNIKCVLFDLDGTLADTSKDMCDCLNIILERRTLKKVDCFELKFHISRGVVGIIEYASYVNGRSVDSSLMRTEFLEDYKKNCTTKTELVPGMDFLLSELENMSIQWGVVTNKHYKFASKIIEGLSIKNRTSCLITGNMVNNPKPSPEMLLIAADLLRLDTNNIMYIGDDERDIIAGKSAGMKTTTADFGFIKDDINYSSWNSDYIINRPQDLLDILKKL